MRSEERRYGGHAFREHVDLSAADTARRAQTGVNMRGIPSQQRPSNATRWTSDRAMVRALDGIERTHAYRRGRTSAESALARGTPPGAVRFVVRVPLRDALGPGWRHEVAGHRATARGVEPSRFTDRSEVVAVWRAKPGGGWALHTCYPLPNNP
jgi:hypothetical protein